MNEATAWVSSIGLISILLILVTLIGSKCSVESEEQNLKAITACVEATKKPLQCRHMIKQH